MGAYVGQTPTENPGRVSWELDTELMKTWGTALLRERFKDDSSVQLHVRAHEEDGERGFMFLPKSLAPPFEDLQLSLEWSEGAQVQQMNKRSSWLAPLGLIALVVLVLSGTFITALAARRTLRLSRLQTDFVSSVSHELRTPLTSIHMFVETLQSGRIQDPKRIDECLELLGSETERLSRRIERMLNWAKMEAEQRVYEREDVGVDVLFLESLEALKTQRLLDPGEDISISLADPVPLVCVDRDAVVEALLNLLQNAVRYCPPPRTILLSVERKGSMVGMSVEDDGPGISRPHRTRIFDRFYRIDERLSAYDHARNERGSGLGLAIVQAVAKAHGGRVDLQSEFGQGSRFTLWLPASWH
jgi:signal transduction histidine kinase